MSIEYRVVRSLLVLLIFLQLAIFFSSYLGSLVTLLFAHHELFKTLCYASPEDVYRKKSFNALEKSCGKSWIIVTSCSSDQTAVNLLKISTEAVGSCDGERKGSER